MGTLSAPPRAKGEADKGQWDAISSQEYNLSQQIRHRRFQGRLEMPGGSVDFPTAHSFLGTQDRPRIRTQPRRPPGTSPGHHPRPPEGTWQIALGAHASRWSTADAAQPASEMDSLGTPPPDCRGGFLTQGRHALAARAFHKGIMETAQPSLRLAAAPSPPERLLPTHTAAAGSQGSSRIPEPASPARALGQARSAAASVGSPRRVCAPTRLLWKKPCSSPFLPQGRQAEPPPAAERNQS